MTLSRKALLLGIGLLALGVAGTLVYPGPWWWSWAFCGGLLVGFGYRWWLLRRKAKQP